MQAAVLAQLKAQLALPFISTTIATELRSAQLEQDDFAAAAAEKAAPGDATLPSSKASEGKKQTLRELPGSVCVC
ncbi:MAG: hypothetical protein ACRDZY_03710 [Acidimicrobiales bacterium]